MAAVKQHSRMRSASDPFSDPANQVRTTASSKRQAPPPPPKQAQQPTKVSASRNSSSNDITEAVRDTVVLRTDQSRPSKSSRPPPSSAPVASRPSGKRSQSEDVTEKPRSGKARPPNAKKGSQHADVIDRLDFTGVGPMFHHDGPFDACAPSRNKNRTKAPMHSWGTNPADLTAPQQRDGAYPSAYAYSAFSNDYPEPPKKKVDAIAEAWGIHEPEPFEEFFAGGGTARHDSPASSIYNGNSSHKGTGSRRKDPVPPVPARTTTTGRRPLVPPPQPIFVGESSELDSSAGSPPAGSTEFPKRSKSIMQRIRKMRDAPNVPATPDYVPPSPVSPTDPSYGERPTHKSQGSFLGFGRSGAPTTPRETTFQHQQQASEPFVLIEPQTHHDKDLPRPPAMDEYSNTSRSGDYLDNGSNGAVPTSPGGGGLGRKTSLMKKVGRVVRGTK
ncbi:hypothetical protein D9619_003493 [Psilocybe cf. subviscida]|uniref:Pal1 cell morphology protein n=1 Tax=Psilocybe cf. subviscida TaxID=2480587 RepID=A0A8H5EUP8_9AGAR|nr:hypothetical protein D9619_003493 [Psilocybe cf. subviscida]